MDRHANNPNDVKTNTSAPRTNDLGPWTSGTVREIGKGRVVRVRDTQPVDIDVLGGYGAGRCRGTANEQWGNLGTGDRGPGTEAYGLGGYCMHGEWHRRLRYCEAEIKRT